MASGQSGATDHSSQTVKLEDTFTLLESEDLAVVEGIRRLILEHLSSGEVLAFLLLLYNCIHVANEKVSYISMCVVTCH